MKLIKAIFIATRIFNKGYYIILKIVETLKKLNSNKLFTDMHDAEWVTKQKCCNLNSMKDSSWKTNQIKWILRRS